MGRSISFVSGKGGVGKTSIVAALGAIFAHSGKKVCVVDLDFSLNNLDIVLGVEDKIVFDVIDCVLGTCRINQALIVHPKNKNLYILPCKNGSRYSGNLEVFAELINYLAERFDYVFVDGCAGVGRGFKRAANSCMETIVITTPHISALRDADRVLSLMRNFKTNLLGVVVNMARGDYIAENKMFGHFEIENLLNKDVIGFIEYVDAMFDLSQLTIDACCGERFTAVRDLAVNIEEGTKNIFDISKRYRGFMGFFRRKRRRAV